MSKIDRKKYPISAVLLEAAKTQSPEDRHVIEQAIDGFRHSDNLRWPEESPTSAGYSIEGFQKLSKAYSQMNKTD